MLIVDRAPLNLASKRRVGTISVRRDFLVEQRQRDRPSLESRDRASRQRRRDCQIR